jgi:hypothetical protein
VVNFRKPPWPRVIGLPSNAIPSGSSGAGKKRYFDFTATEEDLLFLFLLCKPLLRQGPPNDRTLSIAALLLWWPRLSTNRQWALRHRSSGGYLPRPQRA